MKINELANQLSILIVNSDREKILFNYFALMVLTIKVRGDQTLVDAGVSTTDPRSALERIVETIRCNAEIYKKPLCDKLEDLLDLDGTGGFNPLLLEILRYAVAGDDSAHLAEDAYSQLIPDSEMRGLLSYSILNGHEGGAGAAASPNGNTLS